MTTLQFVEVNVTAFDLLVDDGLTYRVEFLEPVSARIDIGAHDYYASQTVTVSGRGRTQRIATGRYAPQPDEDEGIEG